MSADPRGSVHDTLLEAAHSVAGGMNENHFGEIERVLLCLEHAKDRASKAAKMLAKDKAHAHLVSALEAAEESMGATHKSLMQGTYYHVSSAEKLC